jgi:hypothetical protein
VVAGQLTDRERQRIYDEGRKLASIYSSEPTAIEQQTARRHLLAIAANLGVDHVPAWEEFLKGFKAGGGYMLRYDGSMSALCGLIFPFDEFI